jgi:hypothetical protein
VRRKSGYAIGKLLTLFIVLNTITLFFLVRTAWSGMDESSEEIINKSKEAEFIGSRKGSIVPVPIPVSNPTVGTGLQAAILYMHPGNDTEPDAPNKTSGAAGMYTSSKSWLAGAFHDGNFMNDKIRLTAFIGPGDLNLKFYGIGDNPILKDHPISYGLEMFGFSLKLLYRLFGNSEWFAGASYVYLDSKTTFYNSTCVASPHRAIPTGKHYPCTQKSGISFIPGGAWSDLSRPETTQQRLKIYLTARPSTAEEQESDGRLFGINQ